MTTPVHVPPTFQKIESNELWQFPMDYPINVIGEANPELLKSIEDIIVSQFPSFDLSTIEINPSKTGKYHSIRVKLHFKNSDQVNNLYTELGKCPLIKTML